MMVGKEKKEEKRFFRQSTLDKAVERVDKEKEKEKDKGKKVSFSDVDRREAEEWIKKMQNELRAVKTERVELEMIRKGLMEKEVILSEMVTKFENRLSELEAKVKEIEKREESRVTFLPARCREDWLRKQEEEGVESGEESAEETSEGDAASRLSSKSGKSGRSVRSAFSTRSLSEAEVFKMKKFVRVNERRERERNIVIKGEKNVGENLSVWVNELLKDRLGVEVKIEAVWRGGNVIVAKLGSIEERRIVMANKAKLAGTKIFIESDLSFEERKRQEEIGRWAKGKRELGMRVKVGLGRVLIGNRWIAWEDKKALKEIEIRQQEARTSEGGRRAEVDRVRKDTVIEEDEVEKNRSEEQDFC